jgi:hypothetical protein
MQAVALDIFLAVLLVLSLAALVMFRPMIRRLRALKEEGRAFRERWRELDPARRREISRTLRRGQPVTDPQEAKLALEAIRNGERVVEAVRPFQLLYAPALVALVVYASVEHSRFLRIAGAAVAGFVVLTSLLQWQRRRKLRAAAAATRALGAGR